MYAYTFLTSSSIFVVHSFLYVNFYVVMGVDLLKNIEGREEKMRVNEFFTLQRTHMVLQNFHTMTIADFARIK